MQDAELFASWGVDYLKYDWCSYDDKAKDTSRYEFMKPYIVMQKALKSLNRDIVYSICQYGMDKVWEWGADVDGNLWRTTEDITDTWQSLYKIGFSQKGLSKYAGPGYWNDPDMLIVGWVGWGPLLHPTRLTPDEQYTHISLWSLLSAPLLIGCDLTKLDDFTLNLLTNSEVIAINQDPLAIQGDCVYEKGNIQVWTKQLSDGSCAVGIFNLGGETEKYDIKLSELGLKGNYLIRDVWQQQNIAENIKNLRGKISSHSVFLFKISNI